MKEKKTVLSVILGVSLVILIVSLVTGLADSLSLMIDSGKINGVSYHKNYNYLVGGLEFGAVALGIAFVVTFICAKRKRDFIGLILAALLVAYLVITAIVLRVKVPTYNNELITSDYTLFAAYLSAVVPLAVLTTLTYLSSLFLSREAKKSEPAEQKEASEEVNENE